MSPEKIIANDYSLSRDSGDAANCAKPLEYHVETEEDCEYDDVFDDTS